MGIYPLLADETCWLLAIDLDDGSWREDVTALREASGALGLEPTVERSRSGSGAHLWFFFDSPVPAAQARKLGELLLTSAMSRCCSLNMRSYDRLFPSQDTLPHGGFGNLIALPLQHAARVRQNTLFLDHALEPYLDQWAYLASVARTPAARVQAILADAPGADGPLGLPEAGEHAPWRARRPPRARLLDSDLPNSVSATLAQRLYINRAGLPAALLDALRRLGTFANPEFLQRQAMRLSTGLTPRVITCFEDLDGYLALPRGCEAEARELLEDLNIKFTVADERTEGQQITAEFNGQLSKAQASSVANLIRHDIGVLCAPPGAGKTVMGASVIAHRGRSTLVLVHRRPLVEQWLARLREFLEVDCDSIGTFGGKGAKPSGVIDVASVQALSRSSIDPDADTGTLDRYGHIVVDECHHVPAVSIERLLGGCRARYITGLTATPYRRDGHHPIIEMQCGPIRHTMTTPSSARPEMRVIRRDTQFDTAGLPPEPGIQEIYSALAVDERRIEFVVRDALTLLESGRAPIVLTERRDHLQRLVDRLAPHVTELVALHGDVTPRRRRDAIARLASLAPGEPRLVLATGRFIGEGCDDPRLDTLLLAMPIAWKGTVVQYAGRLHRPHPDKPDLRIYDYVDVNVPVLRRMFAKRAKTYRAMSYAIGDSDTLL